MIKNTDSSVYAAGLLVLLASIQLGCATDPNQAGPSGVQNVPEPNIVLPGTPALTEWLSIHQMLFSKNTDPAYVLSEETVLRLIQRAAVIEDSQVFKMAQLCFSNEFGLDTVRRQAQSQECLIEIDGFLGAVQECAQLDATMRPLGLAVDGQGLMDQLASLSRFDGNHLCQIQSLRRVRNLMMFYQQWPNLYRYILSRLDSRREYCTNIFVSIVSNDVARLRAASKPFFGLLERIQDRIGTNYSEQPMALVFIPEFSEDSLYQAVASEIKVLSRYDVGSVADLQLQRVVISELRRLCSSSVPNNVVSYYNEILELLDIDRLKQVTTIFLSTNIRHLLKFEICNKLSGDNFSADRVRNSIDHMNQNEAQMAMLVPDEASYEPSQEEILMASQDVNQLFAHPAPELVNTPPASLRVESEENFYASLASAVAENYQRDSGIGPSGSKGSDRDQ